MMQFRYLTLVALYSICITSYSQNVAIEEYKRFREQAKQEYADFRDECNKKYADLLKSAWDWYEGKAPLPLPKENNPIPPKPFQPIDNDPIVVEPIEERPIEPAPQPKPVAPIHENPSPIEIYFSIQFYGLTCEVRLPESAKIELRDCSPDKLGNAWAVLSSDEMNNAIRDCLETRIRYSLSDWAYLQFLVELAGKYCPDKNGATMLAAFLYCQSGYQMRLGVENDSLVLLFGSKHYIYDMPYFFLDDMSFYPVGEVSDKLKICNAEFDGETPMSLYINKEQILGTDMSEERTISSRRYSKLNVNSQVPLANIKFYSSYPTSAINGNPLTRWAMYANTPLSGKTKEKIYPALRQAIKDKPIVDAANILLNWVQTGLEYEYDDKVWGHDRAFFAEESLYYPYADCEDRSILFSRLVLDLLDLDVALIYYPGHLATAVKFDTAVKGDAMKIGGERFVVCDPTYIGASVGNQMPDLEYDQVQAIVLRR